MAHALYMVAHVAALASLCLALVNLFPVPGLDGGYLIMFAVEALLGPAKADRSRQYVLRLAFVMLAGIFLLKNILV